MNKYYYLLLMLSYFRKCDVFFEDMDMPDNTQPENLPITPPTPTAQQLADAKQKTEQQQVKLAEQKKKAEEEKAKKLAEFAANQEKLVNDMKAGMQSTPSGLYYKITKNNQTNNVQKNRVDYDDFNFF